MKTEFHIEVNLISLQNHRQGKPKDNILYTYTPYSLKDIVYPDLCI